mmetsp:Transcript_31858/g.81579  ORF Transcript_31858/g.81579 Transcript_31858/m.81579 type:complete len:214 (+) Transcript_31858:305-946(+)
MRAVQRAAVHVVVQLRVRRQHVPGAKHVQRRRALPAGVPQQAQRLLVAEVAQPPRLHAPHASRLDAAPPRVVQPARAVEVLRQALHPHKVRERLRLRLRAEVVHHAVHGARDAVRHVVPHAEVEHVHVVRPAVEEAGYVLAVDPCGVLPPLPVAQRQGPKPDAGSVRDAGQFSVLCPPFQRALDQLPIDAASTPGDGDRGGVPKDEGLPAAAG